MSKLIESPLIDIFTVGHKLKVMFLMETWQSWFKPIGIRRIMSLKLVRLNTLEGFEVNWYLQSQNFRIMQIRYGTTSHSPETKIKIIARIYIINII